METKTENKKQKSCNCKKQTVTITDNGEVIITSNSGVIKGNGESSVFINGEFTIDADSVRRLSAALQGKQFYVVKTNTYCIPARSEILTSDEAIAKSITCLQKEIQTEVTERKALESELNKARLKSTRILNEVANINSTRRFWERKIHIPE